jgi:hypothetical protein
MAAITWAQVVDFASEMSDVPLAAQTAILAWVNGTLDVELFPDGEDDAGLTLTRIYLAAHFGAGSIPGTGSSGPAGQVTSESAGGLSRSYGSASPSPALAASLWGSTEYGRKAAAMIRLVAGGPWVF